MYPTLFISHGAPNIVLNDLNTKKNLRAFAQKLDKPKYIIIVSAHYISEQLNIIDYESKELMYDFYGFEEKLYRYKYDIKSDKDISLNIVEKLKEKSIDIGIDKNRKSFDHGVWSTLAMMYESLDIPVIQLSLPISYSNEKLIDLGEKLKIFKNEAMLIFSGGITHNLFDMSSSSHIKNYAKDFNQEIVKIINSGDKKSLLNIINNVNFSKNHPSSEHFLPLFIAYGTAHVKKGISINQEMVYSNISLESFAFDL